MKGALLLLTLAAGACSQTSLPRVLPLQPCPLPTSDTEIVCTTRTSAGRTFMGSVRVRRGAVGSASHARLAAARAWQALAHVHLVFGQWAQAVECTNHGIDELGTDYAPPYVIDESREAISGDNNIIKDDGADADSAGRLYAAFGDRCALYVEKNAGSIAEQWWRIWDGDDLLGEVGPTPGPLDGAHPKSTALPLLHPALTVDDWDVRQRLMPIAIRSQSMADFLAAVRAAGWQAKPWRVGKK